MAIGAVIPDGDTSNDKIGKLKILNMLFGLKSDKKVDSFKVGTGTTTPANSDTDLETQVGSVAAMVAGYPIVDESNHKITLRGYLDSATLNGNDLTEIAWCDEDGEILTREVTDPNSKSSSDEFAYVGVLEVQDV
ncbi:hypothetical protein KAR91_44555 [Candidatus Pacearchaeota archaeon]|nr:hypothetical protein [Candidatus Pacearchaeota archaeon]